MALETDAQPQSIRRFLSSRSGLLALCLLALLGLYLFINHTGHVVAALPYLLLMACPLMHFMHGGHHHGSHDKGKQAD